MAKNQAPQRGTYQDYLSGNIAGKNFTFRSLRTNSSPTMTSSKGVPIRYKPVENIEAYDVIVEKGVPTVIRLVGEDTIYKKLQTEDKDVPKKKHQIQFVRGFKVVNGDDGITTLDFMFKTNHNGTNPARSTRTQPLFEFLDVEKIIKKSQDIDDMKYETVKFCREADIEVILMVSRVMGVNMNQSSAEVRYDLRNVANKMDAIEPGSFMRVANSSAMRTKHYVMLAIEEGILVVNDSQNSIAWATNPYQPLDVAAPNKAIIDSFVNKLSTDDGKIILDTIIDMLTPDAPLPKMVMPTKEEREALKLKKTPEPLLVAPDESDEELGDMFDKAVELGVIVKNGPVWWVYQKGLVKESAKNKEGFVTKLKSIPQLLASLKVSLASQE